MSGIDDQPGFRRRFVIHPHSDHITTAVEDDYHCMAVTLRHEGGVISALEPQMDRAPWTTCPGALVKLRTTFEGKRLGEAAGPAQAEKKQNCTHLFDLAALADAHGEDTVSTTFDITVSDPVAGSLTGEIRRNGELLVALTVKDGVITAPVAVDGLSLFEIRDWIKSLEEPQREAARLLQWGVILAHGRQLPMHRQNDAKRMPPNCYTFQPANVEKAARVGKIIDFSCNALQPLDHFDGTKFRQRPDTAT